MDIIKRNFFCLLRYGAFNEYEPVEKMSAYKWGVLQRMAQAHYVEAIVNSARDNTLASVQRIPQPPTTKDSCR